MPKIPYKPEKTEEDNVDYEIVSFEDFCDKSSGSKTDLLTLNDNINYRFCYESDKGSRLEYEGEGSNKDPVQTETSLSGAKHASCKRKMSGSFAPFGRSSGKSAKGSLFGGVLPKPRADGEPGSNEHRYQRFSDSRTRLQRVWERLPGLGAGMVGAAVVCALCVAVWWSVCGALGGAWGEQHYKYVVPSRGRMKAVPSQPRRVWERLQGLGAGMVGAAVVCALCVAVWWSVCGALGGAWGEQHYKYVVPSRGRMKAVPSQPRRVWERLPGLGAGMVGAAVVCALCVAVWWSVCGALGGAWGEQHYKYVVPSRGRMKAVPSQPRRVWERLQGLGAGMVGAAVVCALCVAVWWSVCGALGGAWGEQHYKYVVPSRGRMKAVPSQPRRVWERLQGLGAGMVGAAVVCALCVAVWWSVCGALGGAWGEQHYKYVVPSRGRMKAVPSQPRRVWERLQGLGAGMVGAAVVCALCVAVWWSVCGALGGAWGEQHYKYVVPSRGRMKAVPSQPRRVWERLQGLGAGMVGAAVVCALCVAVWWSVCGALGGAWGEQHYKYVVPSRGRMKAVPSQPRRVWERLQGLGAGMVGAAVVCALCVAVWWSVCGALGGAWGEQHYKYVVPSRGRMKAVPSQPRRVWERLQGLGAGMVGAAVVCALCVAVWWSVCGALGGAWGEQHYKKLWERAHPDNIKKPLSPVTFEKVIPEYRYHDHNNLSTRNKNSTDGKKELHKKSYADLAPALLARACALVPDTGRFDCAPSGDKDDCERRGCCWVPAKLKGAPYCYYPPQYNTFRFVNMTENKHGMRVIYAKGRPSTYPGDFEMAVVDFKYLSDDTLQVKIYDAENKRFEVPIPQIPMVPGPISNLKYRVQVVSSSIGFKIIRNSDNVTIIDTQDVGGLILSDKFLQISAILPTDNVFGFGEHKDNLRRSMDWKTYTMFNRDTVPTPGINLYGTHPFYLAVEKSGKSHGMLLHNSNAMDVVLQPTPAVTYRTIGGILSLLIFTGPSPKDVVSQYTGLIGKPFMPPYWALGFHLCKYGYGDLNTTHAVWQSNRDAGLPFDTQWNDIDYMVTQNDFTYDRERFAGLPQFVDKLHAEGMHYVILIDPGVSAGEPPGSYPPFDRGLQMDVFIKNSTNQPFVGKVWNPKSTVFPDFTHPNATSYWLEMMTGFHTKVKYDGAWIDMNEISNFIDGQLNGDCAPESLPYSPRAIPQPGLRSKTLCMDARHHTADHYHIHNLYSLYEATSTNFALQEIRGKRPFIISRASFPGLGHYAGHWSGDIDSTWEEMRMTIPELLSFSLFGIPMMGSDICGFRSDTSPELCRRWMQLGAFYPFSRNHADNHAKPQDPASLGPVVLEASIWALRLRYRLLPYYYTLFWKAHTSGETVARPLFFEAPEDQKLRDIDDQFLIGPHVMIAPILQQGAQSTNAWFPGQCRWYNIRSGEYIASGGYSPVGEHEMVSVKGGAILPLQEPPPQGPVTTTNSRSRPIQLLAVPDRGNVASGELYWDDGDSINSYEERKYSNIVFTLKDAELKSEVKWWGYGVPSINNITVLAQNLPIKGVTVNGNDVQFDYTGRTKILNIFNLNLPLDKPFTVKWTLKNMVMKKVKNKLLDIINNTISRCKGKHCSDND